MENTADLNRRTHQSEEVTVEIIGNLFLNTYLKRIKKKMKGITDVMET